VARALEAHQPGDRHEISDVEAIGRGVEAAVDGHSALSKRVEHSGLIRKIVDESPRLKFIEQGHIRSTGHSIFRKFSTQPEYNRGFRAAQPGRQDWRGRMLMGEKWAKNPSLWHLRSIPLLRKRQTLIGRDGFWGRGMI
jgi:hypothetical protein